MLDDLGSGDPSLRFIQRFFVHALNMDRSFFGEFASPGALFLTRAIVAFAHSLGIKVLGMGVETEK